MGDLPWPLRYIVDERGRDTGFAAIRGALLGPTHRRAYEELAATHRMIGVASYGPFPLAHPVFDPGHRGTNGSMRLGLERDYVRACEGWAHCFRDPDRHLPPGLPRVLLSESDFCDPHLIDPRRSVRWPRPRGEWDVVYICPPRRFSEVTKNWPLARDCIIRLARGLRLRCLLVGRAGRDVPDLPGVVACEHLPWYELLANVANARMLLVPGILDASPRAVAEALCLDVPVLLNRDILGGWKYLTPFTGESFRDADDVVDGATRILSRRYRPRAWFSANHGPAQAGRRLVSLLGRLDPAMARLRFACLSAAVEAPAGGAAR